MKHSVCFFALFVLVILPLAIAKESEEVPKAEIFAGYNFVNSIASPADKILKSIGLSVPNANGWIVSVTANVTQSFGIEIEGSGLYSNLLGISSSGYTIGAGPKFTARSKTVNGYAHALVGGGKSTAGTSYGAFSASLSASYLAMAFGGGLDWNIGKFAIKAPQVDYVPIRSFSQFSHNLRISAGIVFRVD